MRNCDINSKHLGIYGNSHFESIFKFLAVQMAKSQNQNFPNLSLNLSYIHNIHILIYIK